MANTAASNRKGAPGRYHPSVARSGGTARSAHRRDLASAHFSKRTAERSDRTRLGEAFDAANWARWQTALMPHERSSISLEDGRAEGRSQLPSRRRSGDDVCFAHLHSLCRILYSGCLPSNINSVHSAGRSSVGLTETYGASFDAAPVAYRNRRPQISRVRCAVVDDVFPTRCASTPRAALGLRDGSAPSLRPLKGLRLHAERTGRKGDVLL